MAQQNSSPASSSAVQLVLYWLIVGVPLGLGVYMTVLKLPTLFQ